VTLRKSFSRAARALREAGSVLIGAHVDPDGDAVGSALGMMFILEGAGITSTPVLPDDDPLPSTYAFLPGAERFIRAADASVPDVFVALDSPDTRRLVLAEPLARAARTLIMIDHHPDASFGDAIAILDPEAAATGCLVWELARHLGVEPDERAATCLYTALLTDTGRFSYSNTSAQTFRFAAEMVAAGAVPNDIYRAVYENRSAGAQALLARALGRITVANHGRVAYSWVYDADLAGTGARPAEGEDLIDHIRALRGVEAVFLVKVDARGKARVSLRAKDSTDVGTVARRLGGGGHRAAAGVTLPGGLDEALAAVLPLLPGGRR
jgi:phosphoesterase RecJ-like protein